MRWWARICCGRFHVDFVDRFYGNLRVNFSHLMLVYLKYWIGFERKGMFNDLFHQSGGLGVY